MLWPFLSSFLRPLKKPHDFFWVRFDSGQESAGVALKRVRKRDTIFRVEMKCSHYSCRREAKEGYINRPETKFLNERNDLDLTYRTGTCLKTSMSFSKSFDLKTWPSGFLSASFWTLPLVWSLVVRPRPRPPPNRPPSPAAPGPTRSTWGGPADQNRSASPPPKTFWRRGGRGGGPAWGPRPTASPCPSGRTIATAAGPAPTTAFFSSRLRRGAWLTWGAWPSSCGGRETWTGGSRGHF